MSDERLGEELKRYGLEDMAGDPVDVLLRHIYANHEAALGAKDGTIASLESQNQALQEENERLKREFVQQARQTNANADIVDALQERIEAVTQERDAAASNCVWLNEQVTKAQERAERAEHLLQAIAFDDQGKLQAWLQPLYIREPYVTVLVDKATKLLSPTQETDPDDAYGMAVARTDDPGD
jgi:hypothetical protein